MKKLDILTNNPMQVKNFLLKNDIPFYYNQIECVLLFYGYCFTTFIQTKDEELLLKEQGFTIVE